MNKKKRIIMFFASVIIIIGAIFLANLLLTNFTDNSNIELKGQSFSSAEEAFLEWETYERNLNDTNLDYCPPYKILHTFEYNGNTIVLYSYRESCDGKDSTSYAVRALKHNEDGTLSFNGGFTDFYLREPHQKEDYYYYTNIKTDDGYKAISFLYLPRDTQKDIYVDSVKADKFAVAIQGEEFYICCAISGRDTFLKNLFTEIADRHKIEIK